MAEEYASESEADEVAEAAYLQFRDGAGYPVTILVVAVASALIFVPTCTLWLAVPLILLTCVAAMAVIHFFGERAFRRATRWAAKHVPPPE